MTQGVEYNIKEVKIPDSNTTVELHLLDIAGQSIFKDIALELLGQANMIMLVYDVTSAESFNSLKYWLDEIRQAN
jgi:GTPase SAR1 family protein